MLPGDELHVSLTWPGHGAASRLASKKDHRPRPEGASYSAERCLLSAVLLNHVYRLSNKGLRSGSIFTETYVDFQNH
jgi:hypothetical protein